MRDVKEFIDYLKSKQTPDDNAKAMIKEFGETMLAEYADSTEEEYLTYFEIFVYAWEASKCYRLEN